MMQEVRLDIHQIRQVLNVSNVRFEQQEDYTLGCLVNELSVGITGTRQEPFTYEVPSSWWQHLKSSVMPSWFNRWFPVKMDTKSIDLLLLYPKLKFQLPKSMMGDVVCLMVNNHPRFVFDPYSPESTISMAARIAEQVPMWNPSARACPVCRREIDWR